MLQNIGLFFLTLGSVILSLCVFPRRLVGSWKDFAWEQAALSKIDGGKGIFRRCAQVPRGCPADADR